MALRLAPSVAIATLGFLGISAVIGAVPLILHPADEPLSLPQDLLQHSPFRSYLIPGIILLLAIGLSSLIVLNAVVRHRPGCGGWTAGQGGVLAIWLIVEMAMLRMAIWPHYFYGAIAVAMIWSGLALQRAQRTN